MLQHEPLTSTEHLTPLNASAAGHAEWPEIDASLLAEARTASRAFPVQILPTEWERWVCDTAQAAGTSVDYVAQGLLAAVAALSGAGVLAQVTPSWSEPLVLWQALVGNPSSGKSPALAAVRRQLGEIEDERQAGDAERKVRHASACEHARLLTGQWEEACEAAMDRGEPPPLKPLEAEFGETFVPAQIVIADSTMEALADVVAGNPRGVILWRDELAAWLANLNRYANGGSDRAHWLEAWSAAGITVNRRSRTTPLTLKRFPVSVVGTIQPDRIAEAFAGGDDGMAARFLYAWPQVPDFVSLMDRASADDDAALARLRKIASIAGNADRPHVLRFDSEPLVLLNHFMKDLHRQARDVDGLEAGWLGKGPGTIARLAAILVLLHWSERDDMAVPPGQIDREPVEQAIALWQDHLRPHALAVFTQAGRADRDRHARRAVRWLRSNDLEQVSREQIRCDALAYAVDAEGADRVIARLEQGGILRLAPVVKARHRPARRWEVNPGLRE